MIAPTIIIGLGGIGSEICCRVSEKVKDEEKRKRLRFVCIDTDMNDLELHSEENPEVVTIRTSDSYSVKKYLDCNINAKENWFPVHSLLMGKTPTEGAGQVRAISRLAFEEALREGRLTVLEKLIEELFLLDGKNVSQSVQIVIVSSLVGGTGSGMVLPMSLYLKNFMETRFSKNSETMRGFFLLPEIMIANKSEVEKDSLYCNAYASMRELDAFMRRGDGTLSATKYKKLAMELPNLLAKEYQDCKASPFNFCFLFDERGTGDQRLKSFDDYKEYAANTIYAQTVSSLANKSNSYEDNSIKLLVSSKGRKRYCGAGSVLLKYPRDSVLRYMADQWCMQAIDREWANADKDYTEEVCRVTAYMDAIREHVEKRIRADAGVKAKLSSYEKQLELVSKSKSNDDTKALYTELALKIDEYTTAMKTAGSASGSILALRMFPDQADDRCEKNSEYDIEHYLRDEDGNLIHPNAFRFLMGSLLGELHKGYKETAEQIKNCNKQLEVLFDDPKTKKLEHAKDYIELKKIGGKKILFWAADGKSRKLFTDKIKKQKELTEKLADALALNVIYATGEKQVQGICDAYQVFYANLENYLKDVKEEAEEIEKTYVCDDGSVTRYVCASEACLKRLMEDMPPHQIASYVKGPISSAILRAMKSYAGLEKKPNAGLYFQDFFKETVMKFWEKVVENVYAARLNMDILTALETELRYESNESLTEDKVRARALEVIRHAEEMAEPCIAASGADESFPFTVCAFHEACMGNPGSVRRAFVKKHLIDAMGGQKNNNVSPYELLIYRAVYNLSAGELPMFCAPAKEGEPGGVCYNAYMDTIKKIGPQTEKNEKLTPHVDKRWHLPKFLPDLDDTNQSLMEKRIYTAFVWGMLTGKIEQTRVTNSGGKEAFLYRSSEDPENELLPSNKTGCDELFEVLDVFSVHLPLVHRFLKDMEDVASLEKAENVRPGASKLFSCINWLDKAGALGEAPDPEDGNTTEEYTPFALPQFVPNQRASIFDLIFWLKENTPADEYCTEDSDAVLEAIVGLLEDHVDRFYEKEEAGQRCAAMLKDQFALFLANLIDPAVKRPKRRIDDPCVVRIRTLLDQRIEKNERYRGKIKDKDPMKQLYLQAFAEKYPVD